MIPNSPVIETEGTDEVFTVDSTRVETVPRPEVFEDSTRPENPAFDTRGRSEFNPIPNRNTASTSDGEEDRFLENARREFARKKQAEQLAYEALVQTQELRTYQDRLGITWLIEMVQELQQSAHGTKQQPVYEYPPVVIEEI